MLITKIIPREKDKAVDIFIDNKFSFRLSEDDFVKEKLKIALIISEEKFLTLKRAGKFTYLLNRMLNFLSFRPRSEKEVRDKLKEVLYKDKETDADTKEKLSEDIIFKLKNLKLLDDNSFASWLLDQRIRGRKPFGIIRLRQELYKKGIKKELIEKLLKGASSNEKERAISAASKKLKIYSKLPPREFKSKMGSHLLRQGFPLSLVLSVVDTLIKRQYNEGRLDDN